MSLSSFFSRARSPASSAAASRPLLESALPSAEASTPRGAALGPSLLGSGSSSWATTPTLASLPETKRLVAQTALTAMFSGSHFNICTVRELCELAGRPIDTPAFNALRLMHCVHYHAMSPQLLDRLPRLVNEALAAPAECLATTEALQGVEFDHG